MNKLVRGLILVTVGVGIIFFTLSSGGEEPISNSQDLSVQINQFSEEINAYLNESDYKGEKDSTNQQEVSVSINDFFFDPTVLIVTKGTTVTWTNDGDVRHNVVSWSNSPNQGLNSELLESDGVYSYTFDEAGEYVYFCEPHPFRMRGVVKVID